MLVNQAEGDKVALSFEETERFTDAAGIRIHSNEAGSGPALLTFHGGGPGANAWDNTRMNLPALSEHFQTMLVDLPGYGHSEPLEALEGETQDRFYARAILAFMDARGIERAHLYGTSMSGGPVVRFALDHPERVDKLVLKSPALGAPNLLSTSPPDGIKALGVFTKDPTPENMETMMKLFVPRSDDFLTQDIIDSRFQSAMRAMQAPRPARSPLPSSYLLSEVGNLRPKTLVVWGHQDRMVPLDGALIALAVIPDVRVHIWGNGTGHFVEWEHTDEWNRLVTSFLLND